ncbi:hypothetical protein H634G_10046 [Metarhizium anisopliae BRIP 53293]|uniref:Zn(2)-C6 fungal-type domain-containing protein n=1 Tax=Metarhizium anisopliae BRIP 53293 TaxID=1291518 RepID=A0A0D9NLB3_METAN|nr:hypothetical protein H634G_10046 [Metarhizium anisopliae BRIP 53293]KJK91805.1 hypothetical protein H633G_04327 [Metarhizium anisopliae BRIP 53284]
MSDRQAKQAAKRMRLGTKSCAECRRRKVRCVFSPGNSVCQNCVLHSTACTAQQPRAQVDEAECDRATLRQRVNQLEGLVKSLAGSVHATAAASEPLAQAKSTVAARGNAPAQDLPTTSNASDAPLINLFRDALLISDADGRVQDDDGSDAALGTRRPSLLTSLQPNIPDEATIRSVLAMTRKYWCTWPACYYGSEPHQTFQVNRDAEGEEYLVRVLSHPPLDTAFCKSLLWFVLCLQQLPADSFRHLFPQRCSKQDMLASYLAYCRIMLASVPQDNLDAVQCHILGFKLYINMGMPQKAWACTRSAISTATLLGLNRLDAAAKESHRIIWLLSWETERQLSLILGYPSAVQTTTKTPFGSLPMGLEAPVVYRILYALALVYGDVINRDQDGANPSYATTVNIDENVRALRSLFPVEWWSPCDASDSISDAYQRESAKFLYFLLVKLVHLPYMLKSVYDARYEHSRQSVLEAAREQIRCYVRLRNFPGAEILICELMDFQAFHAGMVLIIGALYMPDNPGGTLHVFSEDGILIESLIASLRQMATLLECRVAEQGAGVLELLVDTQRPPEDVELLVPYFGKLRIRKPMPDSQQSIGAPSTCSGMSTDTGHMYDLAAPSARPVVELSTNVFMTGVPAQFKQGSELRQDWFGVSDVDACYDWQHSWTRMDLAP